MGTHIALAAPADLFTVTYERLPFSDSTAAFAHHAVLAVFVPKDPTSTESVYVALSSGEIVLAKDVRIDKHPVTKEIAEEISNIG